MTAAPARRRISLRAASILRSKSSRRSSNSPSNSPATGLLPASAAPSNLPRTPFVTPPFLLQVLDLVVEPGQRAGVVKIERIGDLPVDVSACIGDPFVAGLAGGCDLLVQLIEFRGVIPGYGHRQQQPTDIGRLFNGANISLGE